MKFIHYLFYFLLTAATSCSTHKQIPPPVTMPETFTSNGIIPLPAKWWQSFNDPTLDALIDQALTDNFTLLTIWDRLVQSEAEARQAGAPLWPSVDVDGNTSLALQDTQLRAGSLGRRSETNSRRTFSLGLVARYELDLWGRIRSTRDAAALDLRATEEQLRSAAITLSAQVAGTWYELVEQRGQIGLLTDQLKTNEEVLELVTLRFRRGQVGAADVLQQRQLVESRRGNLVQTESRADVLAHQLAILLGQAPTEIVADHTTVLTPLPPLPATGLPVELVQNRPDIREAHYNILAANRRVAAAVADRFPRFSVTADANTSGEELRELFDNWIATLAANFIAPVFDAGSRKAEVHRTRAVMSQRLHEYGQTILEALGEVEDALVQERKQQELIISLEKQIELSGQVIERIRDSYRNGAVDYLRVLDVLLTHQALQREHLQAQRQLITFRINLCRALGGGWKLTPPELAQLTTTDKSNDRVVQTKLAF